jgi:hypothetical protein
VVFPKAFKLLQNLEPLFRSSYWKNKNWWSDFSSFSFLLSHRLGEIWVRERKNLSSRPAPACQSSERKRWELAHLILSAAEWEGNKDIGLKIRILPENSPLESLKGGSLLTLLDLFVNFKYKRWSAYLIFEKLCVQLFINL